MLTRNLRALAASARLPNLPSVVCNVWLGVAVATYSHARQPDGPPLTTAAMLALAGVALYLAGNFLNDWADRGWDASRRPERALPQGWFSPGSYLAIALGCGLVGLAAAVTVTPRSLFVALAIAAGIALYTSIHKRSAWAVIPLAGCRALLPVLGSTGVSPAGDGFPLPAVIGCACAVFAYVVGLSLCARHEAQPSPPTRPALGWLGFPLAAAVMASTSIRGLALPVPLALTGVLPLSLWLALCLTRGHQPVSRLVARLLAGLPLVDAIVLLPLAVVMLAAGEPAAFALWTGGLPLVAWLAGLGLQRIAPAT